MASFLSKSCGRVVGVTPGSGWFALPEPREAPSAVPASVVPRLRFSHEPLGDAELPPRARRIRCARCPGPVPPGTTSACAENTPFWCGQGDYHGNYLRVRGEYKPTMWNVCWRPELPPRARRIPNMCSICHMICGTTSACAENTGRLLPGWMPARNYLRVRGEYSSTRAGSFLSMELPPRARRIPHTPA